MAKNDPWGVTTISNGTKVASETNNETTTSIEETDTKRNTVTVFGDNFVDIDSSDKNANISSIEKEDKLSDSFEPLQDSKEYIDRLEVKLRKLQKVSLQKALSERKSDEARRLLDARLQRLDILSSATSTYSESNIEEEVEDNPMLRRLCPDRQAVNISELEKLLDADSLQKLVEELNDCEEEIKEHSEETAASESGIDKQS
jgi:hypothetical protein